MSHEETAKENGRKLNSRWEYMQARKLLDMMMKGYHTLSNRDKKEVGELSERVLAHLENPTQPNIIPAAPGQVDKVLITDKK